jgi:hypothetical protein
MDANQYFLCARHEDESSRIPVLYQDQKRGRKEIAIRQGDQIKSLHAAWGKEIGSGGAGSGAKNLPE